MVEVGVGQQTGDFCSGCDATGDSVLQHLVHEGNLSCNLFVIQAAVLHDVGIAAIGIVGIGFEVIIEVSLEEITPFTFNIVVGQVSDSIFASLFVTSVVCSRLLDGILQLHCSLVGSEEIVQIVDIVP